MADFSDRDVLTRIYQIQAEGGGDNPTTRRQIAQEALDAGVNSVQISRALDLAKIDAGVDPTGGFQTAGGSRVANIASGLGYDLGSTSPLVDLGGVSNLQAAQEGLYAGDFGMPGYETIMQRLYAPADNTLDRLQSGDLSTPVADTSVPSLSIGNRVSRTTDPLYQAPSTGFQYDTPTELVDPETGEFVSTGELVAQNVAQGPLTQSMEQVITPSAVEGQAPTISYDYVPFDPTTANPIVTALPDVTASDFLFSGLLRQPQMGAVDNQYAQQVPSMMAGSILDPLVYGDLNGDGVVDAKDAAMYQSQQGSSGGTAMFNRGGYVQNYADGGNVGVSEAELVQLYDDLLGRAPDVSGIEYWTGRDVDPNVMYDQSPTGLSGIDAVRAAIMSGPEYQAKEAGSNLTRQVDTTFDALFGRDPTMAEFEYYTGLDFDPNLGASERPFGSRNLQDIVADLKETQEFKDLYGIQQPKQPLKPIVNRNLVQDSTFGTLLSGTVGQRDGLTGTVVGSPISSMAYERGPFDPTSPNPIVTDLPKVTSSDFLYQALMNQPMLRGVDNTYAGLVQNLDSIMQAQQKAAMGLGQQGIASLSGFDLNGDGVVDEKDAALARQLTSAGLM